VTRTTLAGTSSLPDEHGRWRLYWTALASLLMTLSLLVHPAGSTEVVRAAGPSASSPCVAGWRELPIPDASFISTPFDIVTRNGKPAWILGGTNAGILALRWDGSAWRRSAASSQGHRGLVGGLALDRRSVLGVGYRRPLVGNGDGALEPISGEIVGASWQGRRVPDPPGQRAALSDVVSLGGKRALAVGSRLEDGRLRAYAARWSGSRWVREDPRAGGDSGLSAIDRAPTGAVWAVGWATGGQGVPRALIVRYRGGGWQAVKAPALPKGAAVLTDIQLRSGREGWATGYLVPKGGDRHIAILLRWNGRRWSRQALPWAEETAALPRSLAVAGNGDLWLAGTQPANDQREARGFIAHRAGASWDVDVLGVPSTVRSEIMAVAATRGGAVAAANVGASLLVLRSCQEGAAPAARASRRSRIKVSDMKARRRTRLEEDHPGAFDGTAAAAVAAPIGIAAKAAKSLPRPVPPSGFSVQDVAGATGLAQFTLTYEGFAADFDGNGYRDVFYSRHGNRAPRLAMNGPGGFSDAPVDAFSPLDRHGCDSADVDADGNLDILCAVGAARGKAVQRHELSLAPDKAGRALVTGARGISDPLGRGRAVGFISLDGDAFPDVFIANAPDREDGLPSLNRFYRNIGGTFVPAPGIGLDSAHGANCVEVSDVDGDGDEDLAYCTAYAFGKRAPGLRLLRNEGGRLKDRTSDLGLEPIGDVAVAFADVSGDGLRDVVQMSRGRLRVSRATGRGFKRTFEASISDAVALAAGDASGDGIADLYIVRGNSKRNIRDLLLVSQPGGRRFVSVRIPHTRRGSADDVIALDHDLNGLTDFVVLNGRQKAGPVQLLAAYPG